MRPWIIWGGQVVATLFIYAIVILFLPLLFIVTWGFMGWGPQTSNAGFTAAAPFWRGFPSPPAWRVPRRRIARVREKPRHVTGEILHPLESGGERRIP